MYVDAAAARSACAITERGRPVAVLVWTKDAAVLAVSALLAELVDACVYPSLSHAVALGVERLSTDLRRRLVDAAIVDGYRRIPETVDPDLVAVNLEAIGHLEPWRARRMPRSGEATCGGPTFQADVGPSWS